MAFIEVFLISVALALDAFALSLCIGIKPNISRKGKIGFKMSFALFQGALSLTGMYLGVFFMKYVAIIPNAVGGMVIAFVGVMMIKEAMENNDDDKSIIDNFLMYIILGISVNIDSIVIGFNALSYVENSKIMIFNAFLGIIINYTLTSIAFLLGKKVIKIKNSQKYTGYLGGIILIILALKMMFSYIKI